MNNKFFDQQSLQLLRAFFKVRDPDSRAKIIKLTESAADVETSTEAAEDRLTAE